MGADVAEGKTHSRDPGAAAGLILSGCSWQDLW